MAKAQTEVAGLPGEVTVMESDGGILMATNSRVIFDEHAASSSRYLSIMLDAVVSCGVVTKARPLLLLGAAGAAIFAVTQDLPAEGRIGFFALAVLLVVGYFMSRSAMLIISSAGENIAVPAKGMARESAFSSYKRSMSPGSPS
jgi:hypothetical protein